MRGEEIEASIRPLRIAAQCLAPLRMLGYQIIGEFSCLGYNTNSILQYFGGMNKGRPNDSEPKSDTAVVVPPFSLRTIRLILDRSVCNTFQIRGD